MYYLPSAITMLRASFLALVVTMSILVGCTTDKIGTTIGEVSQDCSNSADPLDMVGCEFSSFSLKDDLNTTHNNSQFNSDERWVAYFSASWCTHCKPTISALDNVIPNGKLLVFNKESREEYTDMSEWKENIAEEINRSIERPFIHAPSLSETLNVSVIPHLILVENNSIISVRIGLFSDEDKMNTWFASENPKSGYSTKIASEE